MDGDPQLVKQEENKLNSNNPAGVGGFGSNPQNINKNGRPPKGLAWAEILIDMTEEVDPVSQLTFKQRVARKLWELAANGNIQAIKELFEKMDGKATTYFAMQDSQNDNSLSDLAITIQNMIDSAHVKGAL